MNRMNRQVMAAFVRFVVCGGGVGLLSSGALLVMTGSMPIAVANAIVSVLSTVLVNELHSRFTFRTGRASLRVHVESTGTAVVAYLFTTAAMLGLEAAAPHAGALAQQAVYLTASGLAGIGRFVALKVMVFARRTKAPALVAYANHGHTPAELVAAA